MARWCLVIEFVMFIGALSSSGHLVREVVTLGFQSVRGNDSSDTPPLPGSFENIQLRSPNGTHIFCSDADFPNDIFCDVSSLEGGSENVRSLHAVTFNYHHPSDHNTTCKAALIPREMDDESPKEFVFQHAECFSVIDDVTVPTFKPSRIFSLRIDATSSDDQRCILFFDVANATSSADVVGVDPNPIVAYAVTSQFCSTSPAAFGSIGGRQTTYFSNDGRRIRPTD